jgi:hypothetical protein
MLGGSFFYAVSDILLYLTFCCYSLDLLWIGVSNQISQWNIVQKEASTVEDDVQFDAKKRIKNQQRKMIFVFEGKSMNHTLHWFKPRENGIEIPTKKLFA